MTRHTRRRSIPRVLALWLLFAALVLDNPKENPFVGKWTSPLSSLGQGLYENLNNLTGVSALRFSLLDVLLFVLLALTVTRTRREGALVPKPIATAMTVMFAAVVWIELFGMVRGGNFKNSLWQFREIGWLPGVAFIFSRTVREDEDLAFLGKAVVVAAVVKAVLGVYFFFFVALPTHWRPPHATTHQDTLIFVGAILILIVSAFERPTRRVRLRALLLVPLFLLAIVVNNRRLAYVELAGAAVAIWLMMPRSKTTRRFERGALVGSPLLALYLALGWNSGKENLFFTPAAKIASLFSKEDRSAGTRDVENYNLTLMMKKNPLFGTGFGHEYDEVSKGDSIAEIFPLYRYIGHNSVLWLYAVGGLVGFVLIWTTFVVVAWFAARTYRAATTRDERIAAMVALCTILMFIVQAYGDMGFVSWNGVFMVACAAAVVGKLAVTTGAWGPKKPAREPRVVLSARVVEAS